MTVSCCRFSSAVFNLRSSEHDCSLTSVNQATRYQQQHSQLIYQALVTFANDKDMLSIRIYHSSSDTTCQEWIKCTSKDISELLTGLLILCYCCQYYWQYYLSTDASIGDSFICSIKMGTLFHLFFWQYLILTLLSSDALVNSVNNTTVPKRVNLGL